MSDEELDKKNPAPDNNFLFPTSFVILNESLV
jgi:hypothetical protein